jgi:hypothetical protein
MQHTAAAVAAIAGRAVNTQKMLQLMRSGRFWLL